MEKRGVTRLFLKEVANRVSRLKQFSDLSACQALIDVDATLKQMQSDHLQNLSSGVPPPIDESESSADSIELSLNTSVLSGSENSASDLRVTAELNKLKKTNNQLLGEVAKKLDGFKVANQQYIQHEKQEHFCSYEEENANSELDYVLSKVNELEEQINKANEQLDSYQDLMSHRGIEKHDIGMKIEDNTKIPNGCVCRIF